MTRFSIRCVDAVAAEKLAEDLRANNWEQATVDGPAVSFPASNPAGVMAVAEHALESGYATDDEAAKLVGSLG